MHTLELGNYHWLFGTVVFVAHTDGTFSILDNGEETAFDDMADVLTYVVELLLAA
ncbi:hypothetical protein LCGC14_1103600 [marine sediment metagenome]|uniref:Uncharacterized protein n=1 Tax=marine sediment metagenome TaxID=412755 RepID=A0A0F9QF19_9ZZZZ